MVLDKPSTTVFKSHTENFRPSTAGSPGCSSNAIWTSTRPEPNRTVWDSNERRPWSRPSGSASRGVDCARRSRTLRRAFEQAEQAYREERSRLDGQLRQARDQAQDAEELRGQCDQLRSEGDQLRVECDRLRSGVEDLRRTLEEDERSDRQELARVEAELIGLAGRNQELQDLYESTKQLCTEYQARNQGLLGELAQLRSESTARTNAERSQGTERTELPREALAGLWEIADYADPSASQPRTSAPPLAGSTHEIQAVRIEVEDLKGRLTDSEQLQREMAGILAGMGIRIRQL